MSETKFTPGPWRVDPDYAGDIQTADGSIEIGLTWVSGEPDNLKKPADQGAPQEQADANARLIAAAPEMVEALRLHKAWSDSENKGPDYGGLTRETPAGEAIWRKWWDANLALCARAQDATDAALSKALGNGG